MSKQVTTQEFLFMIDAAIHRAEVLRKKLVEDNHDLGVIFASQRTLDSLMRIRGHVEGDKLPKVSKGEVPEGAGLGLSRAIGEWTEDEELLEAARKVEKCFGESW